MGFNVSTINNLPFLSGYYFFLYGNETYGTGMSITALYKRFDEIAARIDKESAIVKSFPSSNFNNELEHAFCTAPWFFKVAKYFSYNEPCLIIMNSHPKEFDFDYPLIMIPFVVLDKIYSSEDDLIHDIIALSINGDKNIIDKISQSNNNISLIKRVKNSIILQPNINGVGFDLKELFKPCKKQDFFIRE